MQKTLAPSTSSTYQAAFNQYTTFCRSHQLQPAPLLEANLMLYVSQLSLNSSPSTIKSHLAAIKHHVLLLGYHQHIPPFPRLYMLTRAIKRITGNAQNKPKRLPITIMHLTRLKDYLASNFCKHDQDMLWAAFTTAFFGFLRSSEFVAPTTKTFDPEQTLLVSDVTTKHSHIHLNIKASKTDPFRHGCTIRLARTNSPTCPVTSLLQLYRIHPKTGPLFTYADGTYLTRRRLNAILKKAIPSQIGEGQTSSHSFRIGAATTAAAAGFPRWLIQQLGRWNSDCFRTYIRIPDNTINKVSALMCKVDRVTDTYDPDLVCN